MASAAAGAPPARLFPAVVWVVVVVFVKGPAMAALWHGVCGVGGAGAYAPGPERW